MIILIIILTFFISFCLGVVVVTSSKEFMDNKIRKESRAFKRVGDI